MSRFGSIGTQYFDDNGDPLSGGKLYFYESGTTTDKDTYSDADQTIANTNPVVLDASGRQPDIYFNGSAKSILTDSDDVQVEVRDPLGSSASAGDAFASWNGALTYSAEDIVQGSDLRYYQSIVNDNLTNDPTTTSGYWMEVRFIAVWDTNYSYLLGALVTASNGALYRSIVADNDGNDPTSSPSEWTLVGSSGLSALSDDTDPTLSYGMKEKLISLSGTTPSVDCDAGNVFEITLSGDTTFSITNAPAAGEAFGFTVILTQDSVARTITWPGAVAWDGGSAPSAPDTDDVAVYSLVSNDQGTTWYAFEAGRDMS